MALFDRLHKSFYWCSNVTMALSCIISEMRLVDKPFLQYSDGEFEGHSCFLTLGPF